MNGEIKIKPGIADISLSIGLFASRNCHRRIRGVCRQATAQQAGKRVGYLEYMSPTFIGVPVGPAALPLGLPMSLFVRQVEKLAAFSPRTRKTPTMSGPRLPTESLLVLGPLVVARFFGVSLILEVHLIVKFSLYILLAEGITYGIFAVAVRTEAGLFWAIRPLSLTGILLTKFLIDPMLILL